MAYFKRPVAASAGPAAELRATPARPRRHLFLSLRVVSYLLIAVGLVTVPLATIDVDLTAPGFVAGAPAGAAIGGLSRSGAFADCSPRTPWADRHGAFHHAGPANSRPGPRRPRTDAVAHVG